MNQFASTSFFSKSKLHFTLPRITFSLLSYSRPLYLISSKLFLDFGCQLSLIRISYFKNGIRVVCNVGLLFKSSSEIGHIKDSFVGILFINSKTILVSLVYYVQSHFFS